MRIACVGRYAHGLILAGLAATAITLAPQPGQALTINELPDYDGTFPGLCAGDGSDNTACEQAVPEARAGDYSANNPQERELGIGRTTLNDIQDSAGFSWNGLSHSFGLSYDGTTLEFDVGGTTVSWAVDLAPTRTLYIRASGFDENDTELTSMQLDGEAIGDLVGDTSADYLAVTDFDWDSDWTLTGDILLPLDGPNGSRPSAQFKLTDLGDTVDTTGISEPATLAIIGAGLLGAGLLRRRRSR